MKLYHPDIILVNNLDFRDLMGDGEISLVVMFFAKLSPSFSFAELALISGFVTGRPATCQSIKLLYFVSITAG